MSAPASYPRWATDGGTRTTPSSGAQDTGFVPATAAAAKIVNWIFNLIYLWIVWLDTRDQSHDADIVTLQARTAFTKTARELGAMSNQTKVTVGSTDWTWFTSNDATGQLLACGKSGVVASSADYGASWFSHTVAGAFSGDFVQCAAGLMGGLVYGVVVGGNNLQTTTVAATNFASSLVARVSGGGNTFGGVAYGGGVGVAAASNGTYTSSDGTTWTLHAAPANAPTGKLFYGASLFVGTTAGGVSTSPDGVTWTARTLASSMVPSSIAFDAASATWYAYGLVSSQRTLQKSTDGITWTTVLASGGTDTPMRVIALPGGAYAPAQSGSATWGVVGHSYSPLGAAPDYMQLPYGQEYIVAVRLMAAAKQYRVFGGTTNASGGIYLSAMFLGD